MAESLDAYLDWYRHDPRTQIGHTIHHFFSALIWIQMGCIRFAEGAHAEALAPSLALTESEAA